MRNPVLNFNSGELSPFVDARSDVEKYRSGCRILENMIPKIYGCARRRPGFKFIDDAYSTSYTSRVLDFEYSDSIAYLVEFNHQICRFFYNGAVLQSGGLDVTAVSPYSASDLFELQYAQLNDVMWLVHGTYAQRKLTRTSATAFSIDAITFTKGPFLSRNDIVNNDSVTLAPSVTTGTGTLTSSSTSSPGFQAGHVGALFKLTQPRVATSVVGAGTSDGVIGSSIAIKGPFTLTSHGTWSATLYLERMEDGVNWEVLRSFRAVNDRNVQFSDIESEDDVQYRLRVGSYVSGSVNVDLTVDTPTQDGICRIDSITSNQIANITVLTDFASTDATTRWYEGAWSGVQGYPRAVAFFEDRVFYASTTSKPQTIWGSKTGDYENFEEGTNASDAFSLTLNSRKRNAIVWLSAQENLLVGTLGGEWVIRASSLEQALTPINFSVKQQSSWGSSQVQAIDVGDAVLFIDRVRRKVRELSWTDKYNKYVANDLTALAEHITKTGITSIAYQKRPDSIVWMTLTDGKLISMTYERDQDVVAFAYHPLGGSGLAKSVAVLDGSTEDEVWINTTRTINSSSVQFIEQMQPQDWGDDQEDQFFLDAAVKYDSTATSTVSTLTHMVAGTVKVLADGAVQNSKTVSAAGAITLDESASVVVAGLSYTYTLEPMRLDVDVYGGSSKGSIKHIDEAVISFLKTGNAQYGRDADNLFSIDWRTTEAYDSPPGLYTGDKVVSVECGYDTEDHFRVTGSDPLDCTVRAIILRERITGR